jgi:hypothetical protein
MNNPPNLAVILIKAAEALLQAGHVGILKYPY